MKIKKKPINKLRRGLVKYIYVFKCFLKEFKELAFLECAGMLFHNLGPAIENLRSP